MEDTTHYTVVMVTDRHVIVFVVTPVCLCWMNNTLNRRNVSRGVLEIDDCTTNRLMNTIRSILKRLMNCTANERNVFISWLRYQQICYTSMTLDLNSAKIHLRIDNQSFSCLICFTWKLASGFRLSLNCWHQHKYCQYVSKNFTLMTLDQQTLKNCWLVEMNHDSVTGF